MVPPAPDTSAELPRVTVVDSEGAATIVAELFSGRFRVTRATHESINAIADTRPALLIVAQHPPAGVGLSGWDLINLASHHRDLCRVPIILTGADMGSHETDAQRLAEHPRVQPMAKPFALEALEEMVHRLLAGARAQQEELVSA